MKLFLDIVRGAVIGLANIIPGVSGGTMMVSMGIYDTLIGCINGLFKHFMQSVKTLLPYAIGMVAAIIIGAFGLKKAFADFPLPTNALFIGLILGSLPMILKELKHEKKGIPGWTAFVLLFALVVVLKLVEDQDPNNRVKITLNLWMIIKLFLMGCLCSATMVIPGVSGSMLLKTMGYYGPVVTDGIPGAVTALTSGNWADLGHYIGILLPFGIGIVVGIFAIAKVMDVLLRKWKGVTYLAILGMVAASPVVILMDPSVYAKGTGVWLVLASVACLALGVFIALKLGGESETAKE